MQLEDSLTGKILIAMPAMGDPRFARSVILICEHSDQGAMGLVLNRPLPELSFPQLLTQLEIESTSPRAVAIRFGGPVETTRGFVLHRTDAAAGDPDQAADNDPDHEGRIDIAPGIAMTATRDILEDLARGTGPEDAVLSLGYCGWHAGQLEAEILDNGWLIGKAADALIFGEDDALKWAEALQEQGIDPSKLSGAAGRA